MISLWLLLIVGGAVPLLLAWLVYPFVMTRRTATQARLGPPATREPIPLLSVILVTKDPPASIRARLVDLLRARYPLDRLEVIVALDGEYSREEITELGGGFARFVTTSSDAPGGKACGLNSAVRAAEGDILVFTDTHQRFDPDAISRLVAALQAGPWSTVSGALHVAGAGGTANLLTRYWEQERRLREAEARVHSSVGVTGAIYAMWRDRWSPLPAGLILDDLYVPMQRVLAGDRVGFEADAIATDTRTTQPGQEFRRKVRTLTGNLQLCAWLPGVLDPRTNPIWLAFVCHKLLRLLTPYCLLAILVGAAGMIVQLAPSSVGVLLVSIAAVTLIVLLSRDPLSRKVRSAAMWGVTMQAAAVVATINGLRGNWNVWRESSKPAGGG